MSCLQQEQPQKGSLSGLSQTPSASPSAGPDKSPPSTLNADALTVISTGDLALPPSPLTCASLSSLRLTRGTLSNHHIGHVILPY